MAISQTDYFGFIEISLQGFWWTRNNSNANKGGCTERKNLPFFVLINRLLTFFLKKVAQKFGHVKKKQYLCTV